MDEFGDIVDSIYKTYFTKFWGLDDFEELKSSRKGFRETQEIYDLLTDHGYKYDLLHRTYSDPHGNPVLNPEYVYVRLKYGDKVPWQKGNPNITDK
jgi:hypothetical protein